MEQLIQTGEDLKEWFFATKNKHDAKMLHFIGVFVTAKVRKELLTDSCQGRIILDGRMLEIQFKNLGGGVYRAFIERNG